MQSCSHRRKTTIIGCDVFRPALSQLSNGKRIPPANLVLLPAHLHVYPAQLHEHVAAEAREAEARSEGIVCLYGECFPAAGDFCHQRRIAKIPGCHCYEMLLGRERFHRIMQESAGTYFLERFLLEGFEQQCIEPLELYDEELRKFFFQHYERLLYVHQPSDPDLKAKAQEVATFLNLALDIQEADYSFLETEITKAIREKEGGEGTDNRSGIEESRPAARAR